MTCICNDTQTCLKTGLSNSDSPLVSCAIPLCASECACLEWRGRVETEMAVKFRSALNVGALLLFATASHCSISMPGWIHRWRRHGKARPQSSSGVGVGFSCPDARSTLLSLLADTVVRVTWCLEAQGPLLGRRGPRRRGSVGTNGFGGHRLCRGRLRMGQPYIVGVSGRPAIHDKSVHGKHLGSAVKR